MKLAALLAQQHAGSVADTFRIHEQDRSVLPHQTSALHKTRTILNAFGPQASRDLKRHYQATPVLADEVAVGRT